MTEPAPHPGGPAADVRPSRRGRSAVVPEASGPDAGGMTALVVFESVFGGTRAVARAVADGLAELTDVRVAQVGARREDAPPRVVPETVVLLVVGVPSRSLGRREHATAVHATHGSRTGLISTRPGVRDWLELVRLPAHPLVVAAFDTVERPDLPGSAARAAQRVLERHGGVRALPVRSFRAIGSTAGLAEGELDAARAWGRELGAHLPVAPA